ncbi:hypothetical protein FB446DRAFT_725288 [Lentinula raphanica]|nr:hypothetical protein FB446DRAFT_725288 [Lentinula raphanica]
MSWCEMAQVVVASILVLSSLSRGQTTNATCDPSFSWADNSNQQSPCLVTALLEGLCDPLGVQVPALPASNHYLGPSPGQATTCECNTVTYMLISACGACQDREWITWDEWKQECSIVELGIFPLQIPTTIDVPSWAYINISMVNGTFDVAAAQNNATLSQPISTSGNSSSFTTSTQPSSTPTSSSDPLPATPTSSSPSTATSQPSSKSLAGAIAGGTIGGFAVIMILVLALLWFLTKPKRRTNNSKVVSPATSQLLPGPAGNSVGPQMAVNSQSGLINMPSTSTVPTVHTNSTPSQSSSSGQTSSIYTTFGYYNPSLITRPQTTFSEETYRGGPEI